MFAFIFNCFFALFLFLTLATDAKAGLNAEDAAQLDAILTAANGNYVDERIRRLSQAADFLQTRVNGDPDMEAVAGLIEFERDRLQLYSADFELSRQRLENAPVMHIDQLDIWSVRDALLRAATTEMQTLKSKGGVTAPDARRYLKLANSISKYVDDLKDTRPFPEKGEFTGASSALTRYLSLADGIAELTAAKNDPDANKLMGALRDTLGSIKFKVARLGVETVNPMEAFEYQGAVVAAQMEVTKQGYDCATESLDMVGELMDHDNPETRARLRNNIDKLQHTLSQENFANAMLDAIIDRLASKLPVFRSFKLRESHSPTSDENVTIASPMLRGAIVDVCKTWATDCWKGGADLFCHLIGFRGAIAWEDTHPGRTYVIGSNKYCEEAGCTGFASITCTGKNIAILPSNKDIH